VKLEQFPHRWLVRVADRKKWMRPELFYPGDAVCDDACADDTFGIVISSAPGEDRVWVLWSRELHLHQADVLRPDVPA
jgi:hypothetical protein